MYHSIRDLATPISIRSDVFRWQMQWLHEQNISVVPLTQLVENHSLEGGASTFSVALTFDDGFEDFFTVALPILSEYGYPSTVFLVTANCGQYNDWSGQPGHLPRIRLMSWSDIEDASKSGVEFGAHTLSHPRLDRISPTAAELEIVGSKAMIEDRSGKRVAAFSYPYGRYSTEILGIVRNHYACACGTAAGLVNRKSDRYLLPRIEAQYLTSRQIFDSLPTAWMGPYLAARDRLHQIRRRISNSPY